MTTDFLNFSDSQLFEFIQNICIDANFDENSEKKVMGVVQWVNNTITNLTILSMIREGIVKITDFNENTGCTYKLTDEYEQKNYYNSKIWNDIQEVIQNKDNDLYQ